MVVDSGFGFRFAYIKLVDDPIEYRIDDIGAESQRAAHSNALLADWTLCESKQQPQPIEPLE
jgi:hypothetical protein